MLEKERLLELIKVKDITKKDSCKHHWILDSEVISLRGRQALNNPDCIGRKATCKLCHKSKIQPERIY